MKELAHALGSDPKFSTTITNSINTKAPLNSPTFTGAATSTGTVVGVSSAMVRLGNVDNASDSDKQISTATQNALDLKAPLAALN